MALGACRSYRKITYPEGWKLKKAAQDLGGFNLSGLPLGVNI